MTSDCKLIISASEDKTVRIWNVQEQKEESLLRAHTEAVFSVPVSEDNRFIVSGSSDNTVRIWRVLEKTEECVLKGHTGTIRPVALSSDCRLVVSGSTVTRRSEYGISWNRWNSAYSPDIPMANLLSVELEISEYGILRNTGKIA